MKPQSSEVMSESDVLSAAWTALAHRVAAIVGALTGLVSLVWDASATAASVRGALAWLAVVLLGRATSWLLARTFEFRPVRGQRRVEVAVTTAEPRETS